MGRNSFSTRDLTSAGCWGRPPWPRSSAGRHRCHSLCRHAPDRSWTSGQAVHRPRRNRPHGPRSAGRRWGGTPCRSGREFWWCAHRATGRSLGSAPPFPARSAAMRFHRGGIDQQFGRRPASGRERMKHVCPHALSRPAHEAIIERLARAIGRGRILPAAAGNEDMHDPADHAPVVNPRLASRVAREVRQKSLKLLVVQPETVLIHQSSPFGDLESGFESLGNPVYGS